MRIAVKDPLPRGQGLGGVGLPAVSLRSQFLIEAPGLLPVKKWACRLPSAAERRRRTGGSLRLDWALPHDVKRGLVVLPDPRPLFASLSPDAHFFPRARLRTW